MLVTVHMTLYRRLYTSSIQATDNGTSAKLCGKLYYLVQVGLTIDSNIKEYNSYTVRPERLPVDQLLHRGSINSSTTSCLVHLFACTHSGCNGSSNSVQII